MAAAVALVAALAIGVAWWDQHRDRRPAGAPPASTTTEVPRRQPLISFPVYAGCGTTAEEVLVDGVSTALPVSLFDHGQHTIGVRVGGLLASVPVSVSPTDNRLLVGPGGKFSGLGVYIAVGALALC